MKGNKPTQPSVRQILWANFLAVCAGVKLGGTKECLKVGGKRVCEVLQSELRLLWPWMLLHGEEEQDRTYNYGSGIKMSHY